MEVELSELAKVVAYLKRLEATPLENIVWLRDGKPVDVSKKAIEEWTFIGLGNRHFAIDQLLDDEQGGDSNG